MGRPGLHAPASVTAGSQGDSPIAITGIGCRFPGAHGPREFWEILVNGTDALADPPGSDPSPPQAQPGRLADLADFDADFFGVSPREAQRTDPQARLLLETAWEAIEDAGLAPDLLAGSRTGVFVGQAAANYWDLLRQHSEPDIYAVVGSEARATLPGRVSFTFDLRGPSISVDTACSASLTAIHQACQSIRAGESILALAAGVNLALLPDEGVAYSQAGMLAPDGRCKFGDASADGFSRSDGVGVVVLKPLDAAVADGDQVYAVILGSAVNNDGRSGDLLMTPGTAGQEELLRCAYQAAALAPGEVDFVEAHGTGTSVGDRTELTALGSVLRAGRSADRPCLVGSVKTNIGHSEAAAGMAGLIKTALSLRHRTIPPSLHCHQPNPAIAWDSLLLKVPTQATALPHREEPAVAGVSAFGISGSNAHVVLREHRCGPGRAASPASGLGDGLHVLTLAAHSPAALRKMTQSYASFFGPGGAGSEFDLRDICHTAAVRRKHFPYRLAVIGRSHEELEHLLQRHLTADGAGGTVASQVITPAPQIAFVFPGQGSQWLGMGRDLLRCCPQFRRTIADCDEAIKAETGVSILEQLEDDASRLAEVDVLQPTLWAVEVALSALWRSLGVEPAVVVGHSMGEVAAAHVAGALELADAAAIICRRSRLARRLAGKGAMAMVGLPEREAQAVISRHAGKVAVAASNSPTATVLSGEKEPLRQLLAELSGNGVFCRALDVDFASHSPQVEEIEPDLGSALRDIRPKPGSIPIFSTVTATMTDGSSLGPHYWTQNLRQQVRFSAAVTEIARTTPTLFVEVSPHPILAGGIRDILKRQDLAGAALESLCREQPAWPRLLETLATIHTLGGHVNWADLHRKGRCAALPTYPWQHTRHWLDGDQQPTPATGGAAGSGPEDRCLSADEHTDQGCAPGKSPSPPQLQPFEVTGVIRLLDPADQTLTEVEGARLQFIASPPRHGGDPSRQPVPQLRAAPTPTEAVSAQAAAHQDGTPDSGTDIGRRVLSEVASVLARPADDIPTTRSLVDLGLDSLMAAELATRLRTGIGVSIPARSLLQQQPLAAVIHAVQAAR